MSARLSALSALIASTALVSSPVLAQQSAPTNVVDALKPYYDQLDIELPQASLGMGEPATDAVYSRILFGSCSRPEEGMEILDQVTAADPDLFLFIGDNVYGDAYSWDATLPELRDAYAALAAAPEFIRLRENAPMLATWDDHDYGMNDFGAQFPYKGYAEEIFLDFWNVPADDVRRSRPGIHDARILGPEGQRIQIIMLDTRYFRGPLTMTDERNAPGRERYIPSEDTSVSMLGDEQWAWLAEELQKPAELRLIVSSIQVHADGHGYEAWRTMPHERERLYNLVAETGANGVVLLSGDRHSSGLYLRDDVAPYPLYEITSSSLNLSFRDENNEAGPNRIGDMYAPVNFGEVAVDWASGDVDLIIRDGEGEAVREIEFNLSDLQID